MRTLEKRADGLYMIEEEKVDMKHIRAKKEQLLARKERLRSEMNELNEELASIELLKEEWKEDAGKNKNPEPTEAPSQPA